MLHAVPRVDLDLAGVAAHRNRDHDRALGEAQARSDGGADLRVRQRLLELRKRLTEERRIPLEGSLDLDDLGHAQSVVRANQQGSPVGNNPTAPTRRPTIRSPPSGGFAGSGPARSSSAFGSFTSA